MRWQSAGAKEQGSADVQGEMLSAAIMGCWLSAGAATVPEAVGRQLCMAQHQKQRRTEYAVCRLVWMLVSTSGDQCWH